MHTLCQNTHSKLCLIYIVLPHKKYGRGIISACTGTGVPLFDKKTSPSVHNYIFLIFKIRELVFLEYYNMLSLVYRMKSLIERYQHVKEGQQFMSASAEAKFWQAEAERVRQQLHNLQENHRQLLGQHLSGLSLENLRGLQEQLETSLHNIRLAKLNGQPEANSRAITSSSSQSSIAARDGATSIRLELSQPHHAERDEEPESPTLGL